MRKTLMMLAAVLVFAAPVLAQTAEAPPMAGKVDGDYGYWLPPDISVHGYQIDRLINLLHWFMGVLFVGWGIFFVYCLVRFRRRSGHAAGYEDIKAKPSKYSEIGVAIFEAVLLLGFSVPIWASVKNDLPKPEDNPVRVRVLAEQFAWNFHYPGADGKFGKTAVDKIDTASNPMGLDKSDPDALDDVVSGEFRLPVKRKVLCDISSKDVIHSFFLPVLRVKQDAIPGMRIPVWFEATKTGRYQVACAQLCGNNHYKMMAPMVIEEESDFNKWLVDKSKPPEEFKED